MSECGSQVNLVSNVYGSQYKALPQKLVKNDKVMKSDQERGGWICFLFFVFMTFAFLLVMICIGAVYIQKLQDNMHRLEHRVDILEKTSADTPCSCKCEEKQGDQHTSSADKQKETNNVEVRAKRWVYPPPESDHMRKEHHGIPSHRIALVYGDPSLVGRSSDLDEEHLFKRDNSTVAKRECGLRYRREDGQMWCTARRRRQYDQYMTSRHNHYYNYFAKAPWMSRPDSEEHYVLQRDGKIKVKEDGIYIVHASVHFSDVGEHDFPVYHLYKTDENGFNKMLISRCAVDVSEQEKLDDDMAVYPCQAWQLVSLNKNDVVYMSIGGYTWFRVEKDTFHLALIRLNGEKID